MHVIAAHPSGGGGGAFNGSSVSSKLSLEGAWKGRKAGPESQRG